MDPNGFMHHRLNDVKRVMLRGNRMRHQGIRADDGYLPIAKPDTAGILEDRLERLEQAPFQIRDNGHADGMYASVGFSDMAEDERAICKSTWATLCFAAQTASWRRSSNW